MKKITSALLFGLLLTVIFGWLALQQQKKPLAGAQLYWLQPAKAIADFTLLDQNQQLKTSSLFNGKWSIVNLGYSFCPDICPSNLIDLVKIQQHLKRLEPKLVTQMVFVSVDPKRDTPEVLYNYVQHFDASIIALTGEKPQIDLLSQSLNFVYMLEPQQSDYYLVSHSDSVMIINPQSQFAGFFRPPYQPEHMAQTLLKHIK